MKNIFESLSRMRDALQRADIYDAETHSEVVRNLIDTVGALAATVEEMQLASGYQGLPEEEKPEPAEPKQTLGKFTPGPWRYMSPGEVHAADGKVANVHFHIARGVYVAEANAKLIAAAPELLEACEQVAEYFDLMRQNYPDLPGLVRGLELARNAIAKAKGESNGVQG